MPITQSTTHTICLHNFFKIVFVSLPVFPTLSADSAYVIPKRFVSY